MVSLHRYLDEAIEAAQGAGRDFPDLLHDLLQAADARLGLAASGVHVHADPEDAEDTTIWIATGTELAPPGEAGWSDSGGRPVLTVPLDVGQEVLGTLSLAFPDPPERVWAEEVAQTVAEEIDNLVFQVRAQERQHRLTVQVQRCLETPIFEEGLDAAVRLLTEKLPLARLLFLYRNEHFLYPGRVAYRLYDARGALVADQAGSPDEDLDQVLGAVPLGDMTPEDLPASWRRGDGPVRHLALVHAGRRRVMMGRLLIQLEEGAPVQASTDQAEILRSCVLQRLADYSKETRNLEKYFSPESVLRLLRTPDYEETYLLPRVEPLGILFVDVSGFTRLSETALAAPDATGRFIDLWSEGATRLLMEHGGVMDKLIGDCIMGLFGPPFFEREPAELAARVTRAALAIQDFTRELIDHEGLRPLRADIEAAGGLDVSTGVNLGSCAVGLYGPNRDYTAFGSGINNAARIQSFAAPGQTLALAELVGALEGREELCEGFCFGEGGHARAKNVANPLAYHEVLRA